MFRLLLSQDLCFVHFIQIKVFILLATVTKTVAHFLSQTLQKRSKNIFFFWDNFVVRPPLLFFFFLKTEIISNQFYDGNQL